MSEQRNYQEISVESLVPFANHPFRLYDGQRFDDMVESVRANGIITPIIVRPIDGGEYEILSGHNRVSAAKEAELESVPAVVRENLSDEDAMFIVTETNLIQRSFADLAHSEKAVAIAVHYDSLKKKSGYRSDLLEEIEEITCSLIANRSRTMKTLGEQYGLSKDTIARYLRINKLTPGLKAKLDNGDFGIYAAVSLSYLSGKEQKNLESCTRDKTIGIRQAEKLRKVSAEQKLKKEDIERILNPEKAAKRKPFKISEELMSEFFTDDVSDDEVRDILEAALRAYRNQ